MNDSKPWDNVTQLTKEQAIGYGDAGAWRDMSFRELAMFQLHQSKLCVPFDKFQEAVEKTLGRPVWTHEFVNRAELIAEMTGDAEAPTIEKIMAMLPQGRKIVVTTS